MPQQVAAPIIKNIPLSIPITSFIYDDYQIDEEFIETVKEMLPAQPWPVGIHKTIASQLGCTNAKVSRTIETLIDTGVFKKQINGHVISNEQNLP